MHGPTDYRSGVGIVLANRDGRIFAGRRSDGRQPPWQMPQGGLGPAEAPEDALFRELREELGTVRAQLVKRFPHWVRYDYPDRTSKRSQMFRGQQHLWFLLRFTGQDSDIDIASHHAEFSGWQWMSPAEVIDSVISFKRQAYHQVLGFFAPLLDSRATVPAPTSGRLYLPSLGQETADSP
jgi:putative (di)nucleoside polyphosphate hydrolase